VERLKYVLHVASRKGGCMTDREFEELERMHAELQEWRGRAEEAEEKLRRVQAWINGHNGRIDAQTQ
jgi:predicted transcriptional regulator